MSFKANDNKDKKRSYDPIPPAEYTMALVKFERKAAKNPENEYLNLQFSVVKGKHKKVVIFEILNLKNSNETAQKIAEGTLAHLMLACGVDTLKNKWDLTKLLNEPFKATVGIEKNATYGDKNKVVKYIPASTTKKYGGEKQEKPPWEKKKKKKKKKKNK